MRRLVEVEVKVFGNSSYDFINQMRYIIGVIEAHAHKNPIDISIDKHKYKSTLSFYENE